MITAFFHISGTKATDNNCLNMRVRGKAKAFLTRLENMEDSLSGPAERLLLSLVIALKTS